MKFARINAYTIGLVFRHGELRLILRKGVHFLSASDTVHRFERAKPFYPPADLGMLLLNEELASMLDVVKVNHNNIAVVLEDGHVIGVHYAGKYAFWKEGHRNREVIYADLADYRIPEGFTPDILMRTDVAVNVRGFVVDAFEKGLLLVNGKLEKELAPGNYFFWKNSTQVSVLKADMRQMQLEISGQELLTRDKANLRLSMFVHYRITDAVKALTANRDFEKQLYVQLQLRLRESVGRLSLDELLERKDSIAEEIQAAAAAEAEVLGTVITGCGIRDVILPGEVKDIMNKVLIAEKNAQANTIMRREETASARSLLNTAKLMEENQMLCRLKEMEFVEKIAEKIQTISISGNTQLADQLRNMFVPGEK